jgi:hypothetical protein
MRPAELGVAIQVEVTPLDAQDYSSLDIPASVRDLAEKLLDLPSKSDPEGEGCQNHANYRPDHRRKEVIIDYCGHRRTFDLRAS